MKKIPLSRGLFTTVDDEDYERLSKMQWCAAWNGKRFYAVRNVVQPDGRRSLVCMHHFILEVPDGMCPDHKNRDPLDNTRRNLRLATAAQNGQNRVKQRRAASSRYKGVCWRERTKKWEAYIGLNKKYKYLGYFEKEHDAARAYNLAAELYFGEFAKFNVIP